MCVIKRNKKNLLEKLDGLIVDFDKNQEQIASLFSGIQLDVALANAIFYADKFTSAERRHRFSLFILLLNKSKNMRSDYELSFHIFREAYISSDNIYKQINECIFPFSLHEYLADLSRHGIDGISLMNSEEQGYYSSLSEQIIIYRGCSDSEVKSGVLGISWTDNLEYALKYVFYSKNDNRGLGVIIVKKIRKQDIWCVFKHSGDPYFEIIYI